MLGLKNNPLHVESTVEITQNSENEGSGLCIEGYEGWDVGRPFLLLGRSPKE